MSLYKEWKDLIGNQTEDSFPDFWEKYSTTEKRIYQGILADQSPKVTGSFNELAAKYESDPVIFAGFLDGIADSLNNKLDVEAVAEDSLIELDIDWERLYFNMHKADADYLYTLSEWNEILPEERQQEIYKDFRRSLQVRKEKTPGRNDPCPCGSGKKYKKCCGANQ